MRSKEHGLDADSRLKQRIQQGQQAYASGDAASAAEYFASALRSAQRLHAAEDLCATLRKHLAGLYRTLGQVDLARRYYRAALEDAQRRHGAPSAEVAVMLNHIAELECAAGRYDVAEPLFRRALAMGESTGIGDDALIGLMASAAQCLGEINKTDEAEALYARAIAVAQSRPATPVGTLGVLWNNAAGLAATCERWEEAISSYGKAVVLLEQAGDEVAVQRRQAKRNYAAALRRYADAIEK